MDRSHIFEGLSSREFREPCCIGDYLRSLSTSSVGERPEVWLASCTWFTRPARAIPLYEKSIRKMRELGDQAEVANAQVGLGHVMHYQGEYQKALELSKESLTLRNLLDDIQGVSMSLVGIGGVLASCRQPEKAARLFGAAEAAFSRSTFQMQPLDQRDYERNVEHARAQLDPDTFLQAWSKGRVLPLERAVAYALEASVRD